MNESIQAQNVFEHKRAVKLAEAIYIEIYGYDFEPCQLLEWTEELSVRIQTIMALEPINDVDRTIIEMAADGEEKIKCFKVYRDLTGVSWSDAKIHVEAICGEHF
jgi:hypothetical protein